MATIDYKQKIKDYMNSSEVDTLYKSMLNNLFPELAESEDEKIRKELLNAFQESENSLYMVLTPHRRESFIAWLEKQGKIVDYYEDRLDECACKYFNKGYKHALEKQAEQNPDEEYNITGISSNKSQGKLGEIIKNLKQEWSEEDESILQGIWDEILANKHQAKEYEWKTYDRFLSWLKSLRPQNTWKPSEHEITVLEKIQHGEINPSNPTLHRVIKCLKKLREE